MKIKSFTLDAIYKEENKKKKSVLLYVPHAYTG